jgi:hypothetical protein
VKRLRVFAALVGGAVARNVAAAARAWFRASRRSIVQWRLLIVLVASVPAAVALSQPDEAGVDAFLDAASFDSGRAAAAQAKIAARWRDGHTAMLVDLLDLIQRTGSLNPQAFIRPSRLTRFLEAQTGQRFGSNLDGWRRWIWSLPYAPHADYGEFKGRLYARLDPRFAAFFRPPVESTIRLDEIQWGGVAVNGIPPLDHPVHLPVSEASYLDDDNIVFGFFIEGEARAYPKRILAWHELALDRVGSRDLTIVYCTLCGTVIPFDSRVGGKVRTFGTSGLLYQSNKLMFDAETNSLWSSLTGKPVVGPLVRSGLELSALPVVTTTWGEWRRRHPNTTVLSLDTGFSRDYSEGAAYRAYFSTDALMFDVSRHDGRLANKAEVLVVRSTPAASAGDSASGANRAPPFAIATNVLRERPVFHVVVDDTNLVVVTSAGGANRVYASETYRFVETDGNATVRDAEGRDWIANEHSLDATFDSSVRLPRASAHRAFWFGWYAQHPDTVLID